MRNRTRGRGRRPKPGPKQPGEPRQPGLPPLQPVYPEERWGAGENEFDERQPDTNASTMELSGPSAFRPRAGARTGPPMMRREPPAQRADRPPRDDRPPREDRGPRDDRGGRGGRRRRRGRRRDNPAAQPVEAVAATPAIADQSLAAALPAAAPLVLPEGEVPEGEAPAPDIAPELRPAPAPMAEKKPRGVVVLAIGLPGSGKSTWFKRRGVTPLSSDMLRNILFDNITEQRYQHLVFSTLRSLLRARLIARMPWNYVDATNLSPKERRHWIHMARGFGYETHAVFFDVPVEVCMDRNQRRERVVLEEVMQRMAAKLRPPKFEEGFAKITVVRVKGAKTAESAAAEAGEAAADADTAEPEEEVEE